MKDNEAELLRARRRYKVLMREYKALGAEGVTDNELQKRLDELLAQYPSLADVERPPSPHDARAAQQAETHVSSHSAEQQREVQEQPHAGMSPDKDARRMLGAHRSRSLPVAEATMAHLQNTLSHLQSTNQFVFTLFFLNLYNESQRRSVFPVVSYVLLALTSIGLALMHRFVLPPCSTYGSHCVPIVLCITLHIATLLYLRAARRVSLTCQVLLVYFIYDFGPSVALSVALYAITMVLLNLYGVPLVVFVCN